MNGPTVIIVGAGIVGAACAAELAANGFRVTVLDASCAGGDATAAGMGHLVVMDDSQPQLALTHFSRTLWATLQPSLPAAAEYRTSGTLWVAADADEFAEVLRKHDTCVRHHIASEVLDAHQLADAEPSLRPGLAGALRVPEDGVVYPPVVATHLLNSARRNGATIRLYTRVASLTGHAVTLVSGETLPCDFAINAAGAHAAALTPGLPIRPRKGHLAITDRYPGYLRHHLVELGYLKSAHSVDTDSVAFNVQPRVTGQLLIGSSRQYDDTSPHINFPLLAKMLARAALYMPGITQLSLLRTWTGFRAATPDKLPLIGPLPGHDGLYLATGHEGLGITTSLGTARLLTHHLLNRPSEIPITPYLPARLTPTSEHP